jgi:hypothetical protein
MSCVKWCWGLCTDGGGGLPSPPALRPPLDQTALSSALGSEPCDWSIFYFLGWSGTESTITEATKWPIVPAPDDDECGAVGGMLGKGKRVLGEDLPQCRSVHHPSHVTWPGLEPRPPRWEAGDKPPELRHDPTYTCRLHPCRVYDRQFVASQRLALTAWVGYHIVPILPTYTSIINWKARNM